MHTRWVRRVVFVGALLWAAVLPEWSLWLTSHHTRTDDRNGDGRSDVWRTYDSQGQVVELAIDSNFDGRSDVHEFYKNGTLVRRESDVNFDDRVDLVEDFDQTTRQRVRSVVDTDFDGTADLLVLFQEGRAVFSKFAPRWIAPTSAKSQAATDTRRGDAPFIGLSDPFAPDLAVHPAGLTSGVHSSGWTPVGLYTCPAPSSTGLQLAPTLLETPSTPARRGPALGLRSPRGPPTPRSHFAS